MKDQRNHKVQTMGIVTPRDTDILCGRGSKINNHPGNRYFRSLIAEVRADYVASPRFDRASFAENILKKIKTATNPPPRFLKYDKDITSSTGVWSEVTHAKALIKTKQALRENMPKIREDLNKNQQKESIEANIEEEVREYFVLFIYLFSLMTKFQFQITDECLFFMKKY